MTGPLVVGLDGSPGSVTAAWWAADEAARRRLPLVLLHSWTTQPLDVPIPQEALSKQRYGRNLLRQTAAELLHRHGDLAVTTELVRDAAAPALLERGENASVLVLGSRGHGSMASFLLGSISLHVLGLAPCPTVTVRAGDPAVETGWGHPAAAERDEVVVGVSEPGPASDALLEFALVTAESYGVGVRAVWARPHNTPHSAPPEPADGRREPAGRTRLTAAVDRWREKFPDVPVTQEVVTEPAANALLSAATRARLTVVGRRHRPSHLTWKLGPVAHAVLHHAPCPVAVVPHDADG
ncbi:universal stress protein [Streptomyces sp. NPDC096132]|uniref:universal stress protein n=1 Tax=Streptomyces sp. NPDC096132 TaxID=3366075 RepID=UPI0038142F94